MTHCLCALSLWPYFTTDKLIITRYWWPETLRATLDWISQQSHLTSSTAPPCVVCQCPYVFMWPLLLFGSSELGNIKDVMNWAMPTTRQIDFLWAFPFWDLERLAHKNTFTGVSGHAVEPRARKKCCHGSTKDKLKQQSTQMWKMSFLTLLVIWTSN